MHSSHRSFEKKFGWWIKFKIKVGVSYIELDKLPSQEVLSSVEDRCNQVIKMFMRRLFEMRWGCFSITMMLRMVMAIVVMTRSLIEWTNWAELMSVNDIDGDEKSYSTFSKVIRDSLNVTVSLLEVNRNPDKTTFCFAWIFMSDQYLWVNYCLENVFFSFLWFICTFLSLHCYLRLGTLLWKKAIQGDSLRITLERFESVENLNLHVYLSP